MVHWSSSSVPGTHSAGTHEDLRALFARRGWLLIGDTPYQDNFTCQDCMRYYLRGTPNTSAPRSRAAPRPEASAYRFNWAGLRASGCHRPTPWGPVANWDGQLVVDNPRFVHAARTFSFADTELRVDDLRT
jgi:hypothetical protein